MMAAFDFPDMHEACGCRTRTTIAPQALMLLNNRLVLQAAQKLSSRAQAEAGSADPASQIQRAWQITFGRAATDQEVQHAILFIAGQQQAIERSLPTATEKTTPAVAASDEALADLCHALLNANEFLFVE